VRSVHRKVRTAPHAPPAGSPVREDEARDLPPDKLNDFLKGEAEKPAKGWER